MNLNPLSMVPGLASFGGSLLGSALSGPSAATKGAIKTLGQGMQSGFNMSNMLQGLAGKAYNPVVDYWSRILSGNRGVAMSALAPDVERMGDQNTAEMKAAQTLMPRGGARATLMSALPFQNRQQIQSLFQSLRPQGAGQLGTLGGSLASNATGMLNASTSAGRTLMDEEIERQKMSREAGAGFGGGLFNIFSGMKNKSGNPMFG